MPAATTTPAGGLLKLGVREPLTTYARRVWDRRAFTYELARTDLRSAHMNSLLGQTWHLLNPALNIAVYFLVFGVVLDARQGVENYVTFLVVGVMFFRLSQDIVLACARSIPKNVGLIRSLQFPRAVIPISISIQQLLAFAPSLVIILVVAVFDGAGPSPHWFAIPLVVAGTVLVSFGFGLWSARLGADVDDLQFILPHVFRVLLYVSGVLFSVESAIENDVIQGLFPLNPFYGIITVARWSIMGEPISAGTPIALGVWMVGAMISGTWIFRKAEYRYGSRS